MGMTKYLIGMFVGKLRNLTNGRNIQSKLIALLYEFSKFVKLFNQLRSKWMIDKLEMLASGWIGFKGYWNVERKKHKTMCQKDEKDKHHSVSTDSLVD